MLISHVLPLCCYRKKLQKLSYLSCGPQIYQILFQLITACGDYCKRRFTFTLCTKYASLIRRTETGTENRLGQAGWCCHCGSHSSMELLIAPHQWCLFYTPSLAIFTTCCYELDSNLAKVEATVEAWWILEFLSVITQLVGGVWWGYQVSQGSVETLFRWGGKHLHHFAAD